MVILAPSHGPSTLHGPAGGDGRAAVAVTGGTGGLGLLVAAWMARTGAAGRLLLLGRGGRAPDAAAGRKLALQVGLQAGPNPL